MTFRCSDYRRAMVLRYLKLKEYNCEKILTEIFRTRLEISQLTTTERNKQYWHYIIQTFIHGLLCSQLFSNPCSDYDKLQDVWTILSLFNHTHSERIISMRSKIQERIVGQAKAITKATSCNHPNQVITNIILCAQLLPGEGIFY